MRYSERLPCLWAYTVRMRQRKWTIEQLRSAAKDSTSIRQVLFRLGLVQAGGNYEQVKRELARQSIDTAHFTGKVWNKGRKTPRTPFIPTINLLVENSTFQRHKLKNRLYREGLKMPRCEMCGWAELSADGRLPLELDHINGDRHDNRIQNLRILCPNCHSLQSTHRGRNIGRRGGETGRRATLKMS
jgi:5-methylcytosine-specific restriction endonuclease McrA